VTTTLAETWRRARPFRWAAVAACAIAIIAVAVLVLVGDDGGRSPGPVVAEEANQLSSTVPTWREFMYGIPVVYNEGDEAAELERATFIQATPGLEIVQTLVAGPRREANLISGSRRFPPTFSRLRDTHPLSGYRLPPRTEPAGERGVELVFVLRAPRPGRYITRGVQLDYRVGDSEHRRVIPNAYAACAFPRGQELLERDCALPPEAMGEV
jgi:hypothetical protein